MFFFFIFALKRVLEWKGLLLTMVGVGGGAPERGW